ncbi:MAG: restriction endonuclease [Nitrospirota bacterium]
MNKLYFGDCLDVLKKLHNDYPQGFIDLVYIDPPFNSKRNYNILFESADLKDTKAQKEAFADTWSNISYKDTLEELKDLDLGLFRFLDNLDIIYISKSAVAYLTTMAIRIYYIHKVLKDTGSFYLHCDPTMSHYLKIICDLIFDNKNFRNEIIWHYRKWPSGNRQFQRNHDCILFFSKTGSNDRVFNKVDLMDRTTSTLKRFGNQKIVSGYDEFGHRLPSEMEDETSDGVARDDTWDIGRVPPIKQLFPTQKPEPLLSRIIRASTNEGDLVADFFCGCGTTVTVAEELKRKWIGVDISHLAIGLIERRLKDGYGEEVRKNYEIDGLPKDLASVKQLAQGVEFGRLKFQDWVIETMIGGIHNPKKTADGGWDGYITFDYGGKKEIALIEVKSGKVNIKNMREFIQVVSKQKADIGVFVCFAEQVTKPMLLAAKEEGYYHKDDWRDKFDKIQILTVEALLNGGRIRIPQTQTSTFKTAEEKEDGINIPKLFE